MQGEVNTTGSMPVGQHRLKYNLQNLQAVGIRRSANIAYMNKVLGDTK